MTKGIANLDRTHKFSTNDDPRKPPTKKQLEVIKLICEGMGSIEIAKVMGISDATVDTHRSNVMHKLGIHSVAMLVRWAIRHGLVEA